MRRVRHSGQVCVQSSTLGGLKTVIGIEADGTLQLRLSSQRTMNALLGYRGSVFLPNISVLFSILFYSCCVVKVKSYQ